MPVDKMMSNKDLLEACYRGDEAAISLFYDRYKDLVYSAIHKWLRKYAHGEERQESISDVFQQAFLELVDNGFAKLKQARDQNKPAALIFLIAYQSAGKYFKASWIEKKRKAKEVNPQFPIGGGGINSIDRKMINALVEEFVDSLNATERDVFELRFDQGLKYEIIARQTGITADNVGVMLLRIKERFKDFVLEKCPSIEKLL